MAIKAPVSSSDARFRLEARDHLGNLRAVLPYRNMQMEAFMGDQGAQLRVEIPFKGYKQVNTGNLWPGEHELWFYDNEVVSGVPIFQGPLWSAVPSSSTGVISASAQCPLSYLAKRKLRSTVVYNGNQPADMIVNLVNSTNGIYDTHIVPSKHSSNAQVASATFKGSDRNLISDLLKSIAAMTDGVDYYMRGYLLQVYGGLKKPAPGTQALEYGGLLSGYSLQVNAQTIANNVDIIGSNGIIGNADDPVSRSIYKQMYEIVDSNSDLTAIASLAQTASRELLANKGPVLTPSVVTKALAPVKDFDFGDQFRIKIDDEYVQFNGNVRVYGWQLTIGQGDQYTTVIYTSDSATV